MNLFSSIYKRRHLLSLYTLGLVSMATAVTAVSSRDLAGLWVRSFVVFLTAGAALLLPWRFAIPVAIAIWVVAGVTRGVFSDATMFGLDTLLELPGLAGVVAFGIALRFTLRQLERDSVHSNAIEPVDPVTGVLEESTLRSALEVELTRSRRFEHSFALVLVDIDEKHQRFAYRDQVEWTSSFQATAALLRRTRTNIDRVYRYGATGFALLLPESEEKQVTGLVRRLRRLAAGGKPREGDPGGPLPVAFGASFFPRTAASVDDLLRRAEVALRVAMKNSSRLQLDGAAALPLDAPETLRQAGAEPASDVLEVTEPEVAAAVLLHEVPVVAAATLTTPELVSAVRIEAGVMDESTEPAIAGLIEIPAPAMVEVASSGVAVSELIAASQDSTEQIEPERLFAITDERPHLTDDDLKRLLGRMDETLSMIRALKAKAS